MNIYSKFVMGRLYTLSFACNSCWKFSVWAVVFFFFFPTDCNRRLWSSPVAQGKESTAIQEIQEMQVQSLGWEDPLEGEMATHSSNLAHKISRTEEPGRLQSTGLQRWTVLSNWARTWLIILVFADLYIPHPYFGTSILTLFTHAGLSPVVCFGQRVWVTQHTSHPSRGFSVTTQWSCHSWSFSAMKMGGPDQGCSLCQSLRKRRPIAWHQPAA